MFARLDQTPRLRPLGGRPFQQNFMRDRPGRCSEFVRQDLAEEGAEDGGIGPCHFLEIVGLTDGMEGLQQGAADFLGDLVAASGLQLAKTPMSEAAGFNLKPRIPRSPQEAQVASTPKRCKVS